MNATVSIDKAGRLVLPKAVRRKLHLQPGDLLDMELGGNEVRLRPRHTALAQMRREGGRVFWDAPGASASVEEIEQAMARGKAERDARASGL